MSGPVYRVYDTDLGLFTVIVDDTIYNYFAQESTGIIVNRDGTKTDLGNRILNTGYLSHVYTTVIYNTVAGTDKISTVAYNRLTDFIPYSVLRGVSVSNTTFENYDYTLTSYPDEKIRIPMRIYSDAQPANLISQNAKFLLGTSSVFEYSAPFGIYSPDTNTNFANTIYIYLYVYNSQQTKLRYLRFAFRDDTQGYYNYCQLTSNFDMSADPATKLALWLARGEPYVPPVPGSDPYSDFPTTDVGGGEPNPTPLDDDIEEDALPTTSFVDAGFCRIYRPSKAQINALANYMWTDTSFLQTLLNHAKQMLENPIESIISLSLVPCVPDVLADEQVKVMYIPITGVTMPPVANQFVRVDCGTVQLQEMYGSALDYNPYTKVQLYLPYIGTVQLDTDEVMNKTLHVVYRIDVVTGLCCASVSAADSENDDVLYQFSGHCSISQPISSADFSGYLNAALTAGKLVAGVSAAAAGQPAIAGTLLNSPTPSISSRTRDISVTQRNPDTGRQIKTGTVHRTDKVESQGASFGELATRGISNTVTAVMGSKTTVEHTGGFSGNSGYIAAVRRPYLIVTRPRIANPSNYGKYNGRPSMIHLNLGTCSGYTQVQSIQLTGINATNPELSELATLLMSGVIF